VRAQGSWMFCDILAGNGLALLSGLASGATAALGTVGIALTVTVPMLAIGAAALTTGTMLTRRAVNKIRNEKYTKYIKTYYPGNHLTDGEKNFARSIFGKDLSPEFLNDTTKHYLPDRENVAGAVYNGENRIEFYGVNSQAGDYSRTPDGFKFGTFIHEMTHLWQGQHPVRSHRRFHHYRQIYNYQLTSHSRFTKFGDEQQAAMVEDYALRFIFNGHSRWIANTSENDTLLKKVVEKQFPTARETRLRIEACRQPSHP